MRSRLWMSAVLVAALAALAGCGDDQTASDPSATPSAPAASSSPTAKTQPSKKAVSHLPACAATWAEGKRLPAHYRGCQEHGVESRSLIFQCEIGSRLATYGPDLYAVPGRTIVKATPSRAKNKDWKFLYNHCVG